MSESGRDRRQWPRMDIALAVRLRSPDFEHFSEEMTQDISEGGLFLRTGSPRPIGTSVDFEVQLEAEGQTLKLNGVVVRSLDTESARQAGCDPGMGIRFTELPTDDRRMLARLIRAHHARFPDGDGAS